jgi:hypothetical protein
MGWFAALLGALVLWVVLAHLLHDKRGTMSGAYRGAGIIVTGLSIFAFDLWAIFGS